MSKATTIKEALKRWEEKHGTDSTKAKDIQLQFQYPPIEKMDSTLSTLKACTKLSLSTNAIEKIVGINGMKNLKILSLGRNYIKSLSGIEALADNLEELWVSYNLIERLRGIEVMRQLRIFYVANNMVKDWSEFVKMAIPPKLEEIIFIGNPLVESLDENVYKSEAMKRLPNVKKLDGIPVVRDV